METYLVHPKKGHIQIDIGLSELQTISRRRTLSVCLKYFFKGNRTLN